MGICLGACIYANVSVVGVDAGDYMVDDGVWVLQAWREDVMLLRRWYDNPLTPECNTHTPAPKSHI